MTPPLLRLGYAAGGFDLFHVGHLNVLRHAKARCDRLIGGVVSDAMLRMVKGVEPFIPEAERLEIVQSIRFVDAVHLETVPDKLETWRALRFTHFFKGDDWRGTARGDLLERAFAAVGVEVVYFPYTRHTSSTLVRRALARAEAAATPSAALASRECAQALDRASAPALPPCTPTAARS